MSKKKKKNNINYRQEYKKKHTQKQAEKIKKQVISNSNLETANGRIVKSNKKIDFDKLIKAIYKANIELKTALHIGCTQKSPVGAFELMKNGAGEYIIPGTSIAGVFIDTLRNLVDITKDENWKLYTKISDQYEENGDKKNRGSALIFHSVNLGKTQPVKIRNRTKIDRKTKTADDGALFSYWEIEPENVNFDIKIEIDNLSLKNSLRDIKSLSEWVELVFSSWKNEGVYFGAHNTSGNGFCMLTKLERWDIESQEKYQENYLKEINEYNPVTEFAKVDSRFKTWKITVDINDEEEGYGTNALLIKGGASHSSLAINPSDGVFINTGKRLFIPGSSLKGTFSMFLEKYGFKDKYLHKFFGQEDSDGKKAKNQGYIYFPDLIFAKSLKDEKKHLINIERHAEDEFTRAVLGSSKFNEERLFYASVEGKIRIPMKYYKQNEKEIKELKKFLQQGCEKRLISLGANGCYPKIEIDKNIIEENNNEDN